jgi:hypothetical protein
VLPHADRYPDHRVPLMEPAIRGITLDTHHGRSVDAMIAPNDQ